MSWGLLQEITAYYLMAGVTFYCVMCVLQIIHGVSYPPTNHIAGAAMIVVVGPVMPFVWAVASLAGRAVGVVKRLPRHGGLMEVVFSGLLLWLGWIGVEFMVEDGDFTGLLFTWIMWMAAFNTLTLTAYEQGFKERERQRKIEAGMRGEEIPADIMAKYQGVKARFAIEQDDEFREQVRGAFDELNRYIRQYGAAHVERVKAL